MWLGIVSAVVVGYNNKEGAVVVGALVVGAVLGPSVVLGEENGTRVGCSDGCNEG